MKKTFALKNAPGSTTAIGSNLVTRAAATLTFLAWSGHALAHDGHGQGGSHWHATDVLGFVALGGMVAVAVWLSRDAE